MFAQAQPEAREPATCKLSSSCGLRCNSGGRAGLSCERGASNLLPERYRSCEPPAGAHFARRALSPYDRGMPLATDGDVVDPPVRQPARPPACLVDVLSCADLAGGWGGWKWARAKVVVPFDNGQSLSLEVEGDCCRLHGGGSDNGKVARLVCLAARRLFVLAQTNSANFRPLPIAWHLQGQTNASTNTNTSTSRPLVNWFRDRFASLVTTDQAIKVV